jgi:hypothetical protein
MPIIGVDGIHGLGVAFGHPPDLGLRQSSALLHRLVNHVLVHVVPFHVLCIEGVGVLMLQLLLDEIFALVQHLLKRVGQRLLTRSVELELVDVLIVGCLQALDVAGEWGWLFLHLFFVTFDWIFVENILAVKTVGLASEGFELEVRTLAKLRQKLAVLSWAKH